MFLGIPSLVFGISENQNKIAENLIEEAYVLGNPKFYKPDIKVIQSWIDLIINNKFLLSNLSKKSKTLIDGEGIRRIYNAINLQNYEFKPVTLELKYYLTGEIIKSIEMLHFPLINLFIVIIKNGLCKN